MSCAFGGGRSCPLHSPWWAGMELWLPPAGELALSRFVCLCCENAERAAVPSCMRSRRHFKLVAPSGGGWLPAGLCFRSRCRHSFVCMRLKVCNAACVNVSGLGLGQWAMSVHVLRSGPCLLRPPVVGGPMEVYPPSIQSRDSQTCLLYRAAAGDPQKGSTPTQSCTKLPSRGMSVTDQA